jgi:hypothetical protein
MSTDDVKDHNDKVLQNMQRMELVAKFFESIGCTDAQAATASRAYSERFTYDGATLSFNGKPVIEAADDVKAHFKTHGLDFLLPVTAPGERPEVNQALLANAKAGNMTSYSLLAREHGKAVIDALLADYKPAANSHDKTADNDVAFKGKKNPWRAESWSVTEQGRIIRTLGLAVAGRMAAAANSRIGATKASKVAS